MKKIWDTIKSTSAMAIVAIISFGVSVYQGFFYERRGEILFTLDPPAKVFDIHQSVGGLDISYSGESLRNSKKTLWIINANIRNAGNAEIRKNDFDDAAPLGLKVEGGEIVDTPSVRATSEYLQNNLKAIKNNNQLLFTSAILEPSDTVFVSFLVLGPEDSKPSISKLGTIAGAAIKLGTSESEQKSSVWSSAVSSDRWWIHPIRMIIYSAALFLSFILVGVLLASILIPIDALKRRKEDKKSREKISAYKRGEHLTPEVRAITNSFLENGGHEISAIAEIVALLKNRAILKSHLMHSNNSEQADKLLDGFYKLSRYQNRVLSSLQLNGMTLDLNSNIQYLDEIERELQHLASYMDIDLTKIKITPMPDPNSFDDDI